MKIVSIIGARPQFIKAALVSQALRREGYSEKSIHTGQHFDLEMSDVFFQDFNLPPPDYELGIHSLSHGAMTGRMLEQIEAVLVKESPDIVVVYGDTDSTLAGALATVKLHIPLAHVEAGLRSFNRDMPEEHNRVLTDHCADLLLCPTRRAVDNLRREGVGNRSETGPRRRLPQVLLVGDVMYDAVLQFAEIAEQRSSIINALHLRPKEYMLATVHRPCNTDSPEDLRNIVEAFLEIDEPIVFPVHPRTKCCLEKFNIAIDSPKIQCIPPVGYFDMLSLEKNAKAILTDSGGMQKEAYFFRVPCITLRNETEWGETVETGWNVLAGSDHKKILRVINNFKCDHFNPDIFGNGQAVKEVVKSFALIE